MRITSKGQVTIPQAVRDRAGLLPDTEVDIVIKGDDVVIVKADAKHKISRGERLIAKMRSAWTLGLSSDKIMRLTRGGPCRSSPIPTSFSTSSRHRRMAHGLLQHFKRRPRQSG